MSDTETKPDELTATLDEIRANHEAANAFGAIPSDPVPRLLAALDEVLKLHQPVIRPSFKAKCGTCTDEQGYRALWPCPEYEDISRVLLTEPGEEQQR